jgi:predicted ArsR family transcriptional regulator
VLGLSDDEVVESLHLLEAEGYLEIRHTRAQGLDGMGWFSVTVYGLDIYLRAYEVSYSRFEQTVLARIAEQKDGSGSERDLSKAVDVPPMVVRHLLDVLAANGDLKLSKPFGGPQSWHFQSVSPRLRRRAGER